MYRLANRSGKHLIWCWPPTHSMLWYKIVVDVDWSIFDILSNFYAYKHLLGVSIGTKYSSAAIFRETLLRKTVIRPSWVEFRLETYAVYLIYTLAVRSSWRHLYTFILFWSWPNRRTLIHDDVIKWDHFPRYWPYVRGIHRSRWIPRTMAIDAELWCCLWSASE